MFAYGLKKVVSILLATLIVSQTLVNVGIGIYYHLNKTYITQQLCENKNNRSFHCNGHCYLSKQLKKAEEGEQKQTANMVKEKEEIITNRHQQIPAKYFPAFLAFEFPIAELSLPISDFTTQMVKPPAT